MTLASVTQTESPAESPVRVERLNDRWLLTSRQFIPRPRNEVFAFFADAFNLEKITPDFLRFEVLTPKPIEMRQGLVIDYSLRLRVVPIRWRTEIALWEPPHRFVDLQRKGRYKLWRHEHTFERADGGTMIGDRVEYQVYGGPFAPLIERLFVRNDVVAIFNFRREWIARQLAARPADPARA